LRLQETLHSAALPVFSARASIQALLIDFLRENITARNLTGEKIGTELFNVRIVAIAGGHGTNSAVSNNRYQIAGIACRRQFSIHKFHLLF